MWQCQILNRAVFTLSRAGGLRDGAVKVGLCGMQCVVRNNQKYTNIEHNVITCLSVFQFEREKYSIKVLKYVIEYLPSPNIKILN